MLFIKYLQLEKHTKLYTNPLPFLLALHFLVSVLASLCSYLVYPKCSTTTIYNIKHDYVINRFQFLIVKNTSGPNGSKILR